MADPFTGEIRAFAFSFPPYNWSQCNGQQIPIQQNNVLYAVIGNTYGGNLQTYFNLPDLRGRVPVAAGVGPGLTPRDPGDSMGEDTVQLTSTSFPAHNHLITVATPGNTSPGLASAPSADVIPARELTPLLAFITPNTSPAKFSDLPSTPALGVTGQPAPAVHNNDQPYLMFNFCICQFGEFPPRP